MSTTVPVAGSAQGADPLGPNLPLFETLVRRHHLEEEANLLSTRIREANGASLANLELGIAKCELALVSLRDQRRRALLATDGFSTWSDSDGRSRCLRPVAAGGAEEIQSAQAELNRVADELHGCSRVLLDVTRHVQDGVARGDLSLPFAVTAMRGSDRDVQVLFEQSGCEVQRAPTRDDLLRFFSATAGLCDSEAERLTDMFSQVFKSAPRVVLTARCLDGSGAICSHATGRGPTRPELRRLLWERDGGGAGHAFGVCTTEGCGRLVEQAAGWEIGHQVAVSRGGGTSLPNLILLCVRCNRSSASHDPRTRDGSPSPTVPASSPGASGTTEKRRRRDS